MFRGQIVIRVWKENGRILNRLSIHNSIRAESVIEDTSYGGTKSCFSYPALPNCDKYRSQEQII